jgi:hypothetical protein
VTGSGQVPDGCDPEPDRARNVSNFTAKNGFGQELKYKIDRPFERGRLFVPPGSVRLPSGQADGVCMSHGELPSRRGNRHPRRFESRGGVDDPAPIDRR